MAEDDLLSRLVDVSRLSPGVRQAHSPPLRARGSFEIESYPFAWLWGLPRSGKRVEVVVTAGDGFQIWRRSFDGAEVVTRQRVRDGLLIEGKGLGRIGMRLSVEDGSLRYETVRAWFGPIPLPLSCVPTVEAWVRQAEGGWWVSVAVRVGPLGVVCRYSGNITPL